jgi:Ca2+-binding RTX toxin-like protein
VPTVTDNRERYYQNLIGLQDRIALYAGALTIDSLATTSDVQLAGLAQGSDAIAYRYALKELNPFAIIGNNELYSPHNVHGEFNLYGPATGTGLTREYLADRAGCWLKICPAEGWQRRASGDRIESYHRQEIKDDRTGQDLTLTVVGRNSLLINNPARIIFGSDSDETLAGSNIAAGDHLYGGGGADTLQGNQGNDYLEGGNGNDTYVWNSGDGIDTILIQTGSVSWWLTESNLRRYQGRQERLCQHFKQTLRARRPDCRRSAHR